MHTDNPEGRPGTASVASCLRISNIGAHMSSLAMNASMQPIVYRRRKARRVRNFGIPGLGRIAFSRDPGEAALFAERFLRTRLEAIITNPYGELVERIDLGSGKVTNLGVL